MQLDELNFFKTAINSVNTSERLQSYFKKRFSFTLPKTLKTFLLELKLN